MQRTAPMRSRRPTPIAVSAASVSSRGSRGRITHACPIQGSDVHVTYEYLKQLRLHEARRLILTEGLDAAAACYRVGYGSPSQFSREYRRLFGAPPRREL